MDAVNEYKKIVANNVIKGLEKRNMQGFYAPTKEEAVKTVLSLISENSTVSWGGSMTINDLNLLDELEKLNLNLLDRAKCTTSEETKDIYHKALSSDYYIMSSNAITDDGILMNIDGNGNRVAALIYGPENVVVIVGINKVVSDVDAGYKRIKNVACPQNTLRLGKSTPCTKTGKCSDCFSPDCICSQIVITRRSSIKNRIKVVIVGENLGY